LLQKSLRKKKTIIIILVDQKVKFEIVIEDVKVKVLGLQVSVEVQVMVSGDEMRLRELFQEC
jgi:hypothetical protein